MVSIDTRKRQSSLSQFSSFKSSALFSFLICCLCCWRMALRKPSLRTSRVYLLMLLMWIKIIFKSGQFGLPDVKLQSFNMKIVLLAVMLAVAAVALKPSEAGVNDWHLNNVGEVRSVSFTKNKLQYVSFLNQIGLIDRATGNIESRFVAPEAEKVVAWGVGEMTVATRHNQLVTYFFSPSGVTQAVNNQVLGGAKKVESYAKVGKKEYLLSAKNLVEDKIVIKEAKEGEEFLKVGGGVNTDGSEAVFLAYFTGLQVCLENYHNFNFNNLYCIDSTTRKIDELIFSNNLLIVSLAGQTFLLTSNLELVHRVEEPLVEFIRGVAVFRSHSYDCIQREISLRRPVVSSREEAIITLEESGDKISFFREQILLGSIVHNTSRSHVLRAWLNLRSELDYDVIIQFSDLQLVSYSASRGGLEQLWKREESLAYIEEVLFLKYNKLDTLDNPYHRNLISHSYRGKSLVEKLAMVPRDLILRLSEEMTEIVGHLTSAVGYALEQIGSIDIKSLRKFSMSKEQEIKYGLRKYLIAVTSYGTLIALDSKTKELLWKINRNSGSQFVSLTLLKRDYETENAILVSYSSKDSKIIIEEVLENGELLHIETRPANQIPEVYKLNTHSLLLREGEIVKRFRLIEDDDLPEKEYYFYNEDEAGVQGWKVVGDRVAKIWNLRVGGGERVVRTASAFRGDQRSHIPLFDREKVFFKNVDFTNLAVLTSVNQTNLGLYIVNGRTGKVQYNAYKGGVNNGLPVNLVYDENNVLVSYYHSKNKIFEIWTVEQYQERIESSAISMISDYLAGVEYRPQENREQTIFESEVYGSPVAIKEMQVSESKMSLTRRNLFVITRENKLYTIGRDFVNTRRPRKDSKEAKGFFSNEKLPEYAYLLPFSPTNYLSYDLPLTGLRTLRFSPADMESSLFVFCFGVDGFLIRTAPDKTFDMITEDFNYLMLLAILVVGTLAILAFRHRLLLAKLKKPHLE